MSMGYAASHGYKIEWEQIQKICPQESKNFQQILDELELDFQDIAFAVAHEYDHQEFHDVSNVSEEQCNKLMESYDQLTQAFEEKTKTGDSSLYLHIAWHGEGDCYDEVEENTGFWTVEGFMVQSQAAKQFLSVNGPDSIEHVAFVEFG